MRRRRQDRIEQAVDRAAAAVLSAAVGFSVFEWAAGSVAGASRIVSAAVSAAVAYLLAGSLLRSVHAKTPAFELRTFSPADLRFGEPDELLLTDEVELLLTEADRLKPATAGTDELVLNDILAELRPESRVVRLFDPAAVPTPAQLNARIEQHLRMDAAPSAPPDASEALYQALRELRRSLQ